MLWRLNKNQATEGEGRLDFVVVVVVEMCADGTHRMLGPLGREERPRPQSHPSSILLSLSHFKGTKGSLLDAYLGM